MPKLLRRRRVLAAVLVAAGIGALLSALAGAAQSPLSVKGDMTFQAVSGPSCTSSVDLCTAGSLSGKLKGTFTWTASSLLPTADTPTTGVVFVTADATVTTADGDLFVKDASALGTTGAGTLAGVWTIIGGTGLYAGASGQITVTGTFVVTSGGSASYTGTVFVP